MLESTILILRAAAIRGWSDQTCQNHDTLVLAMLLLLLRNEWIASHQLQVTTARLFADLQLGLPWHAPLRSNSQRSRLFLTGSFA